MDRREWRRQILAARAAKDRHFRDDPHSPVKDPDFRGLHYFEPDLDYRLVVPLHKESAETLRIPRTGGDVVEYTRVGFFDVDLPEGKGRLAAYRSPAHGDQLWVPLRDATSGKETYGAGRYLEARPLRDGNWLLDLNGAYHPYCAYDEGYTCPMVPFENHLDFPVRAGERL